VESASSGISVKVAGRALLDAAVII